MKRRALPAVVDMMWGNNFGQRPHPICIVCMGAKHVQGALADLQVCAHCSTMPVKILERILKVAVTGTAGNATHQSQALRTWADLMEEVEPMPPLFEGVFGREEDDDAADETWRTERTLPSPCNPDPLAQLK